MKNSVHMNFWNYCNPKVQDEKNVLEWKELGMTWIMTGDGVEKEENRESLTRLLNACEKEGMTAVVCDFRFWMKNYQKVGEIEYRKAVKEALSFYEQFPAVEYALIHDEPETDEQWKDMFAACNILQEESSKIKPFCSLNHRCGKERKVVWDRLEAYYNAVKPDILLYNCYSQCFDRLEDREQGLENYYQNLNLFGKFAKEHDMFLAHSMVCLAHWMVRVPTEVDFRWQLNTAFAHGVKGFYWFHPIELPNSPYYMNFCEPVIDRFGTRSKKFNELAYENKNFMELIERFGLKEGAKLEKTYHVFRSYGGTEYFERGEDEYVYNILNPENRPLILSRFVRADGSRVIMLVNNSQTRNATVTVVFQEKLGMEKLFKYIAPGSALFVEIK